MTSHEKFGNHDSFRLNQSRVVCVATLNSPEYANWCGLLLLDLVDSILNGLVGTLICHVMRSLVTSTTASFYPTSRNGPILGGGKALVCRHCAIEWLVH